MRQTRLLPILFLGLLASCASVPSREAPPKTSGGYVALERFFFGGSENFQNRQRIYYDENHRVRLSYFLNPDGTIRSRKTYRYDEDGNILEYSLEDKTEKGWNRWWHTLGERTVLEDGYQFTEKTSRYEESYVVTHVVRKSLKGVLLYEEERGFDDSLFIHEYNERGDLVHQEFEHEKSDGLVVEDFEYEYEEGLPVKRTKFRGGIVTELAVNTFEDGRLTETVAEDLERQETYRVRYEYSGEKLLKKTWLDADGTKPVFEFYNEYDERGRLVRHGERSSTYERYWQYDFEE